MLDRNRQRVKQTKLPPKPAYWWRMKAVQLVAIDLGDWLWPFTLVNLLWFLCSLTLILLPPATAALFDLAFQAYHGQSPTPRAFGMAVRKWVLRAWLWGVVNAIVGVVLAGAFLFYRAQANDFFMAFTALIAALIAAGQYYFWPYLLVQEQPSMLQALRNSTYTALGDPFLLLVNGGLSLIVLVPGVILVAPLLLILPTALAMLSTYSLLVWLHRRGLIPGTERDL